MQATCRGSPWSPRLRIPIQVRSTFWQFRSHELVLLRSRGARGPRGSGPRTPFRDNGSGSFSFFFLEFFVDELHLFFEPSFVFTQGFFAWSVTSLTPSVERLRSLARPNVPVPHLHAAAANALWAAHVDHLQGHYISRKYICRVHHGKILLGQGLQLEAEASNVLQGPRFSTMTVETARHSLPIPQLLQSFEQCFHRRL